VNERLRLDLPEDLVDTLGGFVLDRLGRVPRTGDRVAVPGGTLEVDTMDDRRVVDVLFKPDAATRSGR
jgi:CBS domain containing-hemolysin-like protein